MQAQENVLGRGGIRSNGEKTKAHVRGSSPQCLGGQEREEVPFCLVVFLKEIRIKVISREGLRKRTFCRVEDHKEHTSI